MKGPVGRRSFVVVHHKLNDSNISRTVRPRIIQFFTDIHVDRVYSHTGYDVISYFRSVGISSKFKSTAENEK